MLHHQLLGSEQGPPLMILHGLFGNGDNWKSIAKQLPEYRIALPDLPGHGQSSIVGHWRHEMAASQVLQLADQLGWQQFSLLGHSLGGKVGLAVSQLAPDRLERLIVADIAPKAYAPHHSKIFQALQGIDSRALANRRQADQELEHLGVKTKMVRQFLLKSLSHSGEHYQWQLAIDALAASQQELSAAPEFYQPYPSIAHFIRGSESDYIQLADYNSIHHYCPKAQIHSIEGAGHWLHAEQPEAFLAVLQQALTA